MNEPKRVRPQLSDEASSYIRALIMSGSLRPGAQVRPEVLGEELQISSTPVREALQSLRVEGFLELVPRKGFQVAPLTGKDIRDIFRVQALIGGELAARATLNASEGDLAELDALHHELIAAAARHDDASLEEKNHAFHREINLLANSRKIIWAMGLVSRYVPRRFYSSIEGWPKATVDDHAKLLEAIRSGDAETARREMEEHLMHSGELLAAHFDERIASADAGDEAQGLAHV
ncbi:GntR family transcriptional regulator [Arthrobacter sp. NyZ413]|uniref:GntR family transcriptional regulator n=1 Tax=Arthrobacter sp. NyZ413 TaxID=3144669 RepID=UPI003BF78C53